MVIVGKNSTTHPLYEVASHVKTVICAFIVLLFYLFFPFFGVTRPVTAAVRPTRRRPCVSSGSKCSALKGTGLTGETSSSSSPTATRTSATRRSTRGRCWGSMTSRCSSSRSPIRSTCTRWARGVTGRGGAWLGGRGGGGRGWAGGGTGRGGAGRGEAGAGRDGAGRGGGGRGWAGLGGAGRGGAGLGEAGQGGAGRATILKESSPTIVKYKLYVRLPVV